MPKRINPSTFPSLVGTQIDHDQILLVSDLGCGSFAQVYKGQVLTPGSGAYKDHYVAVKVLYKAGLSSSQLKTQEREVAFLKELGHHPHLCTLLNAIETETQHYLILELCDFDLFDLIVPKKSVRGEKLGLEEPMVLHLFSQLASIIDYCHSKGIYHRDLKPENILIQKTQNTIKLTDFGLSTKDELCREYGCGSVRYMAPECLDGKLAPSGYSTRSNDVWALGIILINLLTGKNPWVEPRRRDANYALYLTESSALSTLQSQFKLSVELSQILTSVFSPDPALRPSLSTFVEAVQHVPSLRKPTLPPSTAPMPIPKTIPRQGLSPPKSSEQTWGLSWNSASSFTPTHGFFNIPYLRGQTNPNLHPRHVLPSPDSHLSSPPSRSPEWRSHPKDAKDSQSNAFLKMDDLPE
jgi:serine/threonine protein kinase